MNSALLQGMNSDGSVKWQAIAAVATVGGVAIWRSTAPSDTQILADLDQEITTKNLRKYNQNFDTRSSAADQNIQVDEGALLTVARQNSLVAIGVKERLLKTPYLEMLEGDLLTLVYCEPLLDVEVQQQRLNDDAEQLKKMKDSIWLRSFLNGEVAKQWTELNNLQSNAVALQPYIEKHKDYFTGWNKYKEWRRFQQEVDECTDFKNPLVAFINQSRHEGQAYPLVDTMDKITQDITWINALEGIKYPMLKQKLHVLQAITLARFSSIIRDDFRYKAEMKKAQAAVAESVHERVCIHAQIQKLIMLGRSHEEIESELNLEISSLNSIGYCFDLSK